MWRTKKNQNNKKGSHSQFTDWKLREWLVLLASFMVMNVVTIQTNLLSRPETSTLLYSFERLQVMPTAITVHILVTTQTDSLLSLLRSILEQVTVFRFETVITDRSCFRGTRHQVETVFREAENLGRPPNYTYFRDCLSDGEASWRTSGLQKGPTDSKWILFLASDLTLQPEFLQSLFNLGEDKQLSAVGCKLVSSGGNRLVAAGGIIWRDGGISDIGHGHSRPNSPEFTYAKPVDYVSGSCLMVQKEVLQLYEGIYGTLFPGRHHDTDLQMYIQHKQGGEIWYQPRAVALRHVKEHEEVTSQENVEKDFQRKWKSELISHIPMLLNITKDSSYELKASDMRSRKPGNAKLLFIDRNPANFKIGNYGRRSFDHLLLLAKLGFRVTLAVIDDSEYCCSETWRRRLQQAGIEVVFTSEMSVSSLLVSRWTFYDVVLVKGFSTFLGVYDDIRDVYLGKKSLSIVHVVEAINHRIDENLHQKVMEGFDLLGGTERGVRQPSWISAARLQRELELNWIGMADVVVAASETEVEYIVKQNQNQRANIFALESVFPEPQQNTPPFVQRDGILFLGEFHGRMYNNGDAVWYFLDKVYPMILQESPIPVPLVVAGHGIPSELYEVVDNNNLLRENVRFRESPADVEHLFDQARVLIAPHLYLYGGEVKRIIGSAFASGLPVVVSREVAHETGIRESSNVGCVGHDSLSLKSCVLSAITEEVYWSLMQNEGLEYSKSYQDKRTVMSKLNLVVQSALSARERRMKNFVHCEASIQFSLTPLLPLSPCDEGEEFYLSVYSGIWDAVQNGEFLSGYDHWRRKGSEAGLMYPCGAQNTTSKIS